MKRFKYEVAIGLLSLFVGGSSCKKTELMTYSADRNLFFEVSDTRAFWDPAYDRTINVDSVRMYFSLLADDLTSAEIKIPIKMAGRQLDKPLPYRLVIDQANTTAIKGEDFEWPQQHTFPAGTNVDTLRIKINRTPRMQSGTLRLTIELQPNENFKTMIEAGLLRNRSTKVKCYLNDILFPPEGYLSTPGSPGADFYYGPFSRKKLEVLCDVIETQFGERLLPMQLYPLVVFYVDLLSPLLDTYLREQKEAGHPVLEADGTEMTSGEYYH